MTLAPRTLARAGLALLLLAPFARAQEEGPRAKRDAELQAKLDAKLGEAWFTANPWTADYDVARARAKSKGKVIFAYFTRSYAVCPPCEALEAGPFSASGFADFAKDVVLFVHVTSRVPGEKYPQLMLEKGGNGFPYLAYLDAEGDVLGFPPDRTVEAFEVGARLAATWRRLKAKQAPTPEEQVELLLAEIGLTKISLEQAEKRRAAIEGVTREQAARIDAALVDMRVLHMVRALTIQTPQTAVELGKRMYAMFREGQRPRWNLAFQRFYGYIMAYARSAKDADAFAAALDAMKQRFGHVAQAKEFFDAQEKVLERLRASK
jgi:hypothetical protein